MNKEVSNEELFANKDFDSLWEHNQGIVRKVCKKYSEAHVEYDDLVGLCGIGFTKALIKFDPNCAKFSTFVEHCMRSEVLHSLRDTKKHTDNKSIHYKVSNNKTGGETELADTIEDIIDIELDFIKKDLINLALSKIKTLSDRDRNVMELYILDATPTDIGRKLGFTQPYISRIIKNNQAKLRTMCRYQLANY